MQNSGISSQAAISTSRPPAGSTRNRFALQGRSTKIDPRVDAVRRDLADVRLADRVFAPHYAAAVLRTIIAEVPLTADAAGNQPLSQVLPGERFEVLELATEHAWGIAADGAVGYIPAGALNDLFEVTHIVSAVRAPVYDQPDGATVATLAMGTRLAPRGDEAFVAAAGGYMAAGDLTALDALAGNIADIAESLAGVPSITGGRSGAGVDAGGLVFLACAMTGRAAPRFADLQCAALGTPVEEGAPMQRGDLIFFEGHVAIMLDGDSAVHAGPATVVREPLETLLAKGGYGAVIARRRLA